MDFLGAVPMRYLIALAVFAFIGIGISEGQNFPELPKSSDLLIKISGEVKGLSGTAKDGFIFYRCKGLNLLDKNVVIPLRSRLVEETAKKWRPLRPLLLIRLSLLLMHC